MITLGITVGTVGFIPALIVAIGWIVEPETFPAWVGVPGWAWSGWVAYSWSTEGSDI